MTRTFDFGTYERPYMQVTLRGDGEPVVLRVTTPSEYIIEKLIGFSEELSQLQNGQDREALRRVYDFGARLLSCNLEGVAVTAEALREQYHVDSFGMVSFFSAYMDFIHSLHQEKN